MADSTDAAELTAEVMQELLALQDDPDGLTGGTSVSCCDGDAHEPPTASLAEVEAALDEEADAILEQAIRQLEERNGTPEE